MKKTDKKDKKTYLGCTLPALIFIILFIVGSCSIGTYMAKFNQEIIKEKKQLKSLLDRGILSKEEYDEAIKSIK